MPFSSHHCIRLALLAGALLTALPAFASGPNLVQDGDFEQAATTHSGGATFYGQYGNSGSFNSFWAVTQGTVGIDNNDTFVDGGLKSLYLTADGNTDAVAQTLATTPGQKYLLTFYANSDDPQNQFAVLFGGQAVHTSVSSIQANGFPDPTEQAGVNAAEFTPYSYYVTAEAAATSLEFQGSSGTTIELDNISVTPAAVPEASSVASLSLMLALGMGGAFVRSRCKKMPG